MSEENAAAPPPPQNAQNQSHHLWHTSIFGYHLALNYRHRGCFAPLSLGRLITPVSLDEIGAVCSHSRDEALSPKVSSPILSISFDLHYLVSITETLTVCPIQPCPSLLSPIPRGEF